MVSNKSLTRAISRTDCLDSLISRLACIGALRLCRRNNPFLLSLDPELWRRSDPDAFLAFSQRAATQNYLKQAEMDALGLQGLSCEGSFYSPVEDLWLVVALYCCFVVPQESARTLPCAGASGVSR
jgi:hypothetical protein